MSQTYNAMEQADLFDTNQVQGKQRKYTTGDFLTRHKLTIRLDHALGGLIIFLCFTAFIFSVGVEKGKRYAVEELKAERAKYEEMVTKLGPGALGSRLASEAKSADISRDKTAAVPEAVLSAEPEVVDPKLKEIEAEVAAARETISEASRTNGKFTIQMVTYKSERAAQRIIDEMKQKGHKTFLIPSGKYILVCLESFETKSLATKALKQFKSEGLVPSDAYVRLLSH